MDEPEKHEAWAAGMEKGMQAGRGMRDAISEIARERLDVLHKAGKILEAGYIGQDPTTVNFDAAYKAYQVIADYFEQPDPTASND